VPVPALPFSFPPTTLTGSLNGNAVTLQRSETPNTGTGTFNGQSAETASLSLTVLEGSTPLATNVGTAYYLTDPYTPLGVTMTVNGAAESLIYSSIAPLPSTLTVGASGPLASGTYYNSDDVSIGSVTETYSVAANNATSVKYIVYADGTINGVETPETDTYTVSASGSVALVEIDLVLDGTTVTFTAGS
jgi:hypothetical protein